jgi:hypothetical protein
LVHPYRRGNSAHPHVPRRSRDLDVFI